MKKEITTSVERLQMKVCGIISEIVEAEKLIKAKPKLRSAITKDRYKASDMRRQFHKAKQALSRAVQYVGRCDDDYRASIGKTRPWPVESDPQEYFEGMK